MLNYVSGFGGQVMNDWWFSSQLLNWTNNLAHVADQDEMKLVCAFGTVKGSFFAILLFMQYPSI